MEMKVDAKLIRAERERRAWSQEHLASVTGLGLRTIQRIEAKGVASYESVQAIAAALGKTVSDLRLPEEQTPPVPAQSPKAGNAMRRIKQALPALALAIGILGGSAVSAAALLTSSPLWWAGPLVLAGSMVLARAIENHISARKQAGIRGAVMLAAATLLASTIVAYADPAMVGMMIPILGATSYTVLIKPSRCALRRGNGVSAA